MDSNELHHIEQLKEDDVEDVDLHEELSEELPIDNEAYFTYLTKIQSKITRELSEYDDETADKYLDHYSTMWDFLVELRQDCFTLQSSYSQLESTFAMNNEVQVATEELLTTDKTQIENLQLESETSNQLIEKALERIQIGHEMIENLRKDIANLNWEMECMNKMAESELEENPQLAKQREKSERDKAKLISEVSKLSDKLSNALAYQDELEKRRTQADEEIFELSTQLEENEADVRKQQRLRLKLDGDLQEIKDQIVRTSRDISIVSEQLSCNNEIISNKSKEQQKRSMQVSKCTNNLQMWTSRYNVLETQHLQLMDKTEKLKSKKADALTELSGKDEKRVKLRMDYNQAIKERELFERRIRLIELDNDNLVAETLKLKDIALNLTRHLTGRKADVEDDKKTLGENIQERDALNRKLLRQQAIGREQAKIIQFEGKMKLQLFSDIDERNQEQRRLGRQILHLEKERDRFVEDTLEKNTRFDEVVEELSLQSKHVASLKKALADHELARLARQVKIDEVITDRNRLWKTMQENLAQMRDMRMQLRINHRQTEQLKEQIAIQDVLINKAEMVKRKTLKERENLKIEYNVNVDTIRQIKVEISDRRMASVRMAKFNTETVARVKEQKAAIRRLANERNLLGTQLTRREDEISLVEEKIRLLESLQRRGEGEYEERLQDIKLLKIEVKRLRCERNLLERSITNMNDLKVEVLHLERDLTNERMKANVLEDELHNPLNVQRWRKLRGRDADIDELLKRIVRLEKRFLGLVGSMIEVETELHDTQLMYLNLRKQVDFNPAVAAQTKLNKVQKNYVTNQENNKAMIAELNMLHMNNGRYDSDIKELKSNLIQTSESLQQVQKNHFLSKLHVRELQTIVAKDAVNGKNRNLQKDKQALLNVESFLIVSPAFPTNIARK